MEKLMDIIQDYENLPKLFPGKMKCIVLDKNDKETVTHETIYVSKFHIELNTKSSHKKISSNTLETKIILGPLKGSQIQIKFKQINQGTQITVNAALKLSLKYKILGSFIKKRYKILTTGFLHQVNDLALVTEGKSWKESLICNGDAILVSHKGAFIKLYGWWLCTLSSCFINDDYRFLPVKGKIVIDIGANVGDSTIYFAINGAQKVIALEPFPIMFTWAQKNVEENNLKNVILLQAGCSSNVDTMIIDPEISNVGAILKETKRGVTVPLTTLENILVNHDIESAVLKMNCEGCEYDVILSSPQSVIKKFSHILIAFHNGYHDLERRLLESNFTITIIDHPQYKEQGWIIATRNT
jgi:FkbM family methyltransferase